MDDVFLGVVIVTYNSGREAVDCVETLISAAQGAGIGLRVAVVDNASSDDTVAGLRAWAAGTSPYVPPEDLPFAANPLPKPVAIAEGGPDMAPMPDAGLSLIQTDANLGFAGGVNVGLAYLARFPGIRHFWVLNPDSVVPPATLAAIRARLLRDERYALMGGRVCYLETPDKIQIDGGVIDKRTGVTHNLNLGKPPETTPPPLPEELDFIMGASMIASREFYERAGPMPEDYFLYYEEVDWAMRRGDLPLAYCEGLVIYHRAGSSIGSPGWGRTASPFSLYFKHRARMRFQRRFNRKGILTGYAYTLMFALRRIGRNRPAGSWAVLAGAFELAPPAAIRNRLRGAAGTIAFRPFQP